MTAARIFATVEKTDAINAKISKIEERIDGIMAFIAVRISVSEIMGGVWGLVKDRVQLIVIQGPILSIMVAATKGVK